MPEKTGASEDNEVPRERSAKKEALKGIRQE